MSVREYIGARYVPLFADPIDWDSTKTYEPLTIVYNQGNSYTSRQYVPAGIDISNDTYWARTGNYNAQIEQYRHEVATFDGRITTNETNMREIMPFDETPTEGSTKGVTSDGIKKAIDTAEQTNADAIANEVTRAKGAEQANADAIANEVTRAKGAEQANADAIANEVTRATNAEKTNADAIQKLADNITFQPMFMPKRGDVSVCFGDSNAEGFMLENPSTENFYYQICQQLGLEYHNYSVDGSGFATKNNILAQVKAAAADTAITKDSVKFVILLAGRNDYFNSAFSAAQIAPSIREVINTIYTTFPNAIIFAGDMDWSYYYPTLADMEEMRKIRAAYLSTEAPVVVVPTWHIGLDTSMSSYYNNIDHYNLKAHTILAKTFISKMFFGTTYVEKSIINSGFKILDKNVISTCYGYIASTINPDALSIVNTGTVLIQTTAAKFTGTDPVISYGWAKINSAVTHYISSVLMQTGGDFTIYAGTVYKSNVVGNIKTNKSNYSTIESSFTCNGKPETPTAAWGTFTIPC